MRRIATVILTVVVAAGAAVLAGADGAESDGKRYRAVFDNAFGLTEGGDLKIAGVRAGETTGFKVSRSRPHKAVVEFEITEPGVGELLTDTECVIKPQSLIGEYFVDCQPGRSGRPLEEDGTVPVEQTASTIPVDLVNNILRRPYRERLRLIIAELGTGLAGRSEDLGEVLRRAHPGLRETSRTLRVLGDQRQVIQRFIADAQVVTEQLENRKADVARWVGTAGDAATITASRREALRRNFQLLPGFLSELQPYMARLEDLADEQIPLLADLEAAAPDLDTFLARLGPFSEASRPAFRGLGRASLVGSRAFRASRAEVDELRELALGAPRLAVPLRKLLQTLDDRERAVEVDPRAKATAPPAPDKTAIADEGGFTGMEAVWNYFFWQGQAINVRDDVGHVLKITGIDDSDCVSYYATDEGEEETFARCNQFLGPDQPGITTPDPIPPTTPSSGASRDARGPRADARSGRDRSPAEADPAPADGSPVLPPALRDLLGDPERLPLPARPDATAPLTSSDGMSGPLIDFLLAP